MRIAGIESNSIVDGDGLRYVIFFQGCSHNCKGCQNPQTHDFNGGKEVKVEDMLRDLENCNSDGLMDITLSGGDPFFQADEAIELCKELKKINYNIWAYTGFVFDDFLSFINGHSNNNKVTKSMIKLLNYIDVVVDGPFIESKRTLECRFRGSSNQRLIDVQKSIKNGKVVLYKGN